MGSFRLKLRDSRLMIDEMLDEECELIVDRSESLIHGIFQAIELGIQAIEHAIEPRIELGIHAIEPGIHVVLQKSQACDHHADKAEKHLII